MHVRLKGDRVYLHLLLDFQNPFKWYNGETATGPAGFGGTPLLNMTVALKW